MAYLTTSCNSFGGVTVIAALPEEPTASRITSAKSSPAGGRDCILEKCLLQIMFPEVSRTTKIFISFRSLRPRTKRGAYASLKTFARNLSSVSSLALAAEVDLVDPDGFYDVLFYGQFHAQTR